ncbi:MAG: hypothetical protein CMO12_04705 [Thaumarchaeota archaeon]|jgi:cytochrome c oxidase assembly protein subunit 15|nr:hypothetical protein [Nitrososphaerota archaeon]|tara:strand:+ start:4481 stop:4888 length:408 start_codon:yes stop_codon:yes gene_type:complete
MLIFLGGLVTSFGQGLSAGIEWPLPREGLLPTASNLLEYLHRAFSGIAGVLILTTAIIAWRNKTRIAKALTVFAIFTLILVSIQILLGMVVLQSLLHPVIVAIHNSLGTTIFASSFVTFVIALMQKRGTIKLSSI